MLQTVIGIFEDSYVARKAGEALIENGFDNGSIEINDHVDVVDEFVTDGQMTDTTDRGALQEYSSNTEKAGSMVSVHVNYSGETLLATGILGDFGAVDVNEFTPPEETDR